MFSNDFYMWFKVFNFNSQHIAVGFPSGIKHKVNKLIKFVFIISVRGLHEFPKILVIENVSKKKRKKLNWTKKYQFHLFPFASLLVGKKNFYALTNLKLIFFPAEICLIIVKCTPILFACKLAWPRNFNLWDIVVGNHKPRWRTDLP